jgi:hypothetical protein
MMRKNPAERFQTVQEVAHALEAWMEEGHQSATPPGGASTAVTLPPTVALPATSSAAGVAMTKNIPVAAPVARPQAAAAVATPLSPVVRRPESSKKLPAAVRIHSTPPPPVARDGAARDDTASEKTGATTKGPGKIIGAPADASANDSGKVLLATSAQTRTPSGFARPPRTAGASSLKVWLCVLACAGFLVLSGAAVFAIFGPASEHDDRPTPSGVGGAESGGQPSSAAPSKAKSAQIPDELSAK